MRCAPALPKTSSGEPTELLSELEPLITALLLLYDVLDLLLLEPWLASRVYDKTIIVDIDILHCFDVEYGPIFSSLAL